MSNPFKILHERHPRTWCIATFVPMVIITCFAPVVFLYTVIIDIPRIMSNLWDDIKGCYGYAKRRCRVFGYGWRAWAEGWEGVKKCQ